jgi:hypothetical protein
MDSRHSDSWSLGPSTLGHSDSQCLSNYIECMKHLYLRMIRFVVPLESPEPEPRLKGFLRDRRKLAQELYVQARSVHAGQSTYVQARSVHAGQSTFCTRSVHTRSVHTRSVHTRPVKHSSSVGPHSSSVGPHSSSVGPHSGSVNTRSVHGRRTVTRFARPRVMGHGVCQTISDKKNSAKGEFNYFWGINGLGKSPDIVRLYLHSIFSWNSTKNYSNYFSQKISHSKS